MSEQMKLCMCGLPAQSYTTESANGVIKYAIGCNDRLCHWTAGEYDTEAAAIAAWNQRAGEAEVRRLRELERACMALVERKAHRYVGVHWYVSEDGGLTAIQIRLDAIGRLLEGEE